MDDDANIGMPKNWVIEVQDQLKKMKAFSGTVNKYGGVQPGETLKGTIGEPQPVGESMEQQIARIDRLLQEKDPNYDLRQYQANIGVSISTELGGEMAEVQTEIRAIPQITTVRTSGESVRRGNRYYATLNVKFALLGQGNRHEFIRKILLPKLATIKGLNVISIDRVDLIAASSSTIKEDIAALYQTSQASVTPRLSIEDVVSDWAEGGVMDYDVPMSAYYMRYHVMVPVQELRALMSREFRKPMDGFQGGYQNFISRGPQQPVVVAIGKNGRAKITGNEDDVWYAIESGLEELPVFFSYQNQI
jgi:hypothetical protein